MTQVAGVQNVLLLTILTTYCTAYCTLFKPLRCRKSAAQVMAENADRALSDLRVPWVLV